TANSEPKTAHPVFTSREVQLMLFRTRNRTGFRDRTGTAARNIYQKVPTGKTRNSIAVRVHNNNRDRSARGNRNRALGRNLRVPRIGSGCRERDARSIIKRDRKSTHLNSSHAYNTNPVAHLKRKGTRNRTAF